MAAIAALVCLILALILGAAGVTPWIDLAVLGLAFMALWMLIGNWPLGGRARLP